MKKSLLFLFLLILPINIFAYSDKIIPGGNTLGIEVKNDGVIVIGFYKVNGKFNKNDFKVGDVVEVFGPNLEPTKIKVVELINNKNENVDVARHPQEILKLKVPFIVQKNDIIRVPI